MVIRRVAGGSLCMIGCCCPRFAVVIRKTSDPGYLAVEEGLASALERTTVNCAGEILGLRHEDKQNQDIYRSPE